MRHWVIAAAAFVVVALLTATLLQPEAEPLSPAATEGSEAGSLTFERARTDGAARPEWRVGDAWRVLVDGGPEWEHAGAAAAPCLIGVVEADATRYRMGASCPDLAARLAIDPNLPFAELGPDLDARAADAERTAFFQWPLHAGDSWTTTFLGRDVVVTAKYEPAVEGPLGKEPGFLLEMVDEAGERVATYTFAPSLQWWSTFELSSGARLEVVGHERGHGETLMSASAEEVLSARYTTGAGNPVRSFDVGPDAQLVYIDHLLEGPNAQYVRVEKPSGAHAYDCLCSSGASTGLAIVPEEVSAGSWRHARVVDAEPGTWSVLTPRAGTGTMTLTVHAVRLTEHVA